MPVTLETIKTIKFDFFLIRELRPFSVPCLVLKIETIIEMVLLVLVLVIVVVVLILLHQHLLSTLLTAPLIMHFCPISFLVAK